MTCRTHEGDNRYDDCRFVGRLSVALNRLDGVYYVDPRPEMVMDERLRSEIASFQHFLVHDLWTLTK